MIVAFYTILYCVMDVLTTTYRTPTAKRTMKNHFWCINRALPKDKYWKIVRPHETIDVVLLYYLYNPDE